MTAPHRRRLLRSALLLAVGLLLVWLLVACCDGRVVKATLAGADPGLVILALALFLTQSVTVGARWWVALRLCGYEGRFLSLIRANSASNLINFLAPGHFGEPISAGWLARTGRAPGAEAFGLLVATKVVGTTLHFVVLLACLPVLLAGARTGAIVQTAVMAVAGLVVATLVAGAMLHPAVARWGTRTAELLTRSSLRRFDGCEPGERRSERLAGKVRSTFERVRGSFVLLARDPLALGAVAGLGGLKSILLAASFALLYSAIGHPMGPAAATFVMSSDGLANIASVWIPGNLGIQEFVHSSAAAGGLGVPVAVAVSAALIVKGMMAIHALFGAGLWLGLAPLDRAPSGGRVAGRRGRRPRRTDGPGPAAYFGASGAPGPG